MFEQLPDSNELQTRIVVFMDTTSDSLLQVSALHRRIGVHLTRIAGNSTALSFVLLAEHVECV